MVLVTPAANTRTLLQDPPSRSWGHQNPLSKVREINLSNPMEYARNGVGFGFRLDSVTYKF